MVPGDNAKCYCLANTVLLWRFWTLHYLHCERTMNEYLRFVLAVFTCYRLARLVALDDGPGFVFKRIRYWVKDKAWLEADREDGINRVGVGEIEIDDRHFGKWHNLAEGITCPFCIGIYASVLVFPMLVWPTYYGDLFLLLVSLSGAQAFLQTLDKGD